MVSHNMILNVTVSRQGNFNSFLSIIGMLTVKVRGQLLTKWFCIRKLFLLVTCDILLLLGNHKSDVITYQREIC
jgi:hypothetical protein